MRGEKTQIGYIVSVKDDEGNICPVMRKSKVGKRITRSTLDAETLAMEEGLENGIWIGRIWEKIYGKKVTVIGYTDGTNLEEAVKSLKGVENKRTRIEMVYLKKMIESGEVAGINWIKKNRQVADGLTKKIGFRSRLIRYVEGDNNKFELKRKEKKKELDWGFL